MSLREEVRVEREKERIGQDRKREKGRATEGGWESWWPHVNSFKAKGGLIRRGP